MSTKFKLILYIDTKNMNIFQLSNYNIVKLIPIDSLQLTLYRYKKLQANKKYFYDGTTKNLFHNI